MKDEDIKVGQEVETVYGFEVTIVDILPNSVVAKQYEEGLILLKKSELVT